MFKQYHLEGGDIFNQTKYRISQNVFLKIFQFINIFHLWIIDRLQYSQHLHRIIYCICNREGEWGGREGKG